MKGMGAVQGGVGKRNAMVESSYYFKPGDQVNSESGVDSMYPIQENKMSVVSQSHPL